ncbi:hypothetical protein [Sorangium sp. So ce1335]
MKIERGTAFIIVSWPDHCVVRARDPLGVSAPTSPVSAKPESPGGRSSP